MKKQEVKDLHAKTKNELQKLLKEAKEALMNLNLDHQQNKLKNTRSIFTTRKQIAVVSTILRIKANEVVEEVVGDLKAASQKIEKVAAVKKADKGGKK